MQLLLKWKKNVVLIKQIIACRDLNNLDLITTGGGGDAKEKNMWFVIWVPWKEDKLIQQLLFKIA